MASQQTPPSRSASCYNCGANDHFMMACPEPTRKVPAGLEAARASQAAQAAPFPQGTDNAQDSGHHRPYKRQKLGPVVTKYPAAGAPPVITRYHQTHLQPATYQGGQNYYAAPTQAAPTQYHQQQIPYGQPQPQPYNQQGYQQPYGGYGPSVHAQGSQAYSQPTYVAGQTYGQFQPSTSYQDYGYPPRAAQHHPPYTHHSVPGPPQQHGYQQPHSASYQTGTYQNPVSTQQYGHDPSRQYPQNEGEEYREYGGNDQNAELAPQDFVAYRNAASNASSYQAVPQNQPPYRQDLLAHLQGPANHWSQTPSSVSGFDRAPNGQSHPSYQQSYQPQQYQNQLSGHQYDSQSHQNLQPHLQRPRSYSEHGQPNHSSTSGNPILRSPSSQKSPTKTHHGSTMNHKPYSNYSKSSRSASTSSNPRGSHIMTEKSTKAQGENELTDLDWDMEKIFIEIPYQDACPISHPLQMSFDGESIHLPASNNPGLVTKYVRPGNLHIFVLPIDKSLHWATLRFDPVFKAILEDDALIPLDELESWLQEQHRRCGLLRTQGSDNQKHSPSSHKRERSEDEQEDVNKQISIEVSSFEQVAVEGASNSNQREYSEDIPADMPNFQHSRTPTVGASTPTVARAGTPSLVTEDDAWAPKPGEGHDAPSMPADPTEALLAALGVTGSPKPVTETPADFYAPPAIDAQAYQEEASLQETQHRKPSRQDSGYVSARGSYSNASTSGGDGSTNRIDHRQPQWSTLPQPPPPPPPPQHLRKQYDGLLESPPSDGSNRDSNQRHISGSTDNTRRHESAAGYFPGSSPLTPTSAELLNHETVVQEWKNGRKPEPLRQVDDVTPKLKRRQPKVADAYSRRW